MNEPSRLSDREVTDMLRRRSARPAPHGLASAILESLASERARHLARTTGRSAKRPLILLAAAALLLAGGALAAGSGALRLWSITPPEPAPSLGLVDFPNLTTTFVSPRNGFSVKHPDRVALTPAKQLWGFGPNHRTDGFDVVETGLAAVFKGASLGGLDDGNGSDEWVDAAIEDYGVCGIPRSQQAEITIDGQSGRISECPNQIEATVIAGGRLYLFTLAHERTDARGVFDAFAATIDLTPETAVNFPNLTSTFVSPINGFSFGYLDRGQGTLQPATERWDPASEPPTSVADGPFGAPLDDGFDLVETGMGAFFKAASTDIPEGVAIDDWIDASLASRASTRTCMAPRSQQAEITIDGQPGRISEGCSAQYMATVVVDRRLYVFILLSTRSDARAFFDAFASTIDLRPGSAAVPSSTPSS